MILTGKKLNRSPFDGFGRLTAGKLRAGREDRKGLLFFRRHARRSSGE
jgi:hypothetical protein